MSTDEIVCVSWKTSAMPVPAFIYGHRKCLEEIKRPNQEVHSLTLEELPPGWTCSRCGGTPQESKWQGFSSQVLAIEKVISHHSKSGNETITQRS